MTRSLKKVDYLVLAWGGLIALGSLIFQSGPIVFGAALGAVVAYANWLGFRMLVERPAVAGELKTFVLGLAVKTVVVLTIVTLIFVFLPIHAVAFLIGLGSLVLGILSFSFHYVFARRQAAMSEEV